MDNSADHRIAGDLERRIEIIEALGDAELGKFTKLDWLLCIAGSVVIPAILLARFAG